MNIFKVHVPWPPKTTMVTEFVLVLFIVTCFAQTPIYEGIALVQSQEMSEVNGTVLFQQTGTSVSICVIKSGSCTLTVLCTEATSGIS